MEKLERKTTTYGQMMFITAGCIALGAQAHNQLNIEYALHISFVFWLLLTILWFVYGRKPAAWIKNNKLFIRDGHFKAVSIEKENIEYIKYKKISNKEHELVVKMPNFSEWIIPIHDEKEHINDNRLYAFINKHFIEL